MRRSSRRPAVVAIDPMAGGASMPIWLMVVMAAVVLVTVAIGVAFAMRDTRPKPPTPEQVRHAQRVAEQDSKNLESTSKTCEAVVQQFATVNKMADEALRPRTLREDALPAIVKIINLKDGKPAGTGTGFVINDKNWIATNFHVIANGTSCTIRCFDDTEFECNEVVAHGSLDSWDLAVLKPKDGKLSVRVRPLRLGSKETVVHPGATVYACGNPGLHEFCVSRGTVTRIIDQRTVFNEGRNTDIPFQVPVTFDMTIVEHDARIFPGNSGGPLINEDCVVIGVNTWANFFPLESYPGKKVITYGMASHVWFLQDMLASAKEGATKPYDQAARTDVISN